MWIITKIIISVLEPFMHICNLSLSKGIFPLQMKIAKVIPMFKSGDKSQFNNYRPISVLSHFLFYVHTVLFNLCALWRNST